MRALRAALLFAIALAVPARAELPVECRGAENLVQDAPALPRVGKAIDAKRLDILVLGAGSSMLPGANGASKAYPARLQIALAEKLPEVAVKVTSDTKAKRTAAEMLRALPTDLIANRPKLVIWQLGTIDAMHGVDPDAFSATLDKGVETAHSAGVDVILVNMQYSPRTESMIALSTYAEIMRWVALQHEVPLFDRFAIMKLWSELGTFDLFSATKKLDMAEHVHDCIGRLLGELIVEAAKPEQSPSAGER